MRFLLSEEQRALQETVRDYAMARGAEGARRRAFEGAEGIDLPFWRGLMALGAGGVGAPEAAGGLGLGLLEVALVAEALGYAAAAGPFLGHVLAIHAIEAAGSDAQKQRWLARLASGEAVGTTSATAPPPGKPGSRAADSPAKSATCFIRKSPM